VPSQQLQGQLQIEHSVNTGDYIMDKHNIKSKTNYRQALEENTLMQKSKQTNKVIQFFIIFVPSPQPQGQLQAQHSVDTDNYIMDKHNIKSKTNNNNNSNSNSINTRLL
jgi:hypothetical protein